MSKWSSAYRDSRWQRLRLEVMARDFWKCQSCDRGDGDGVTLNVHHAYYEKGKAPWEYDQSVLFTFCEECHKRIHAEQKRIALKILSTASCMGDGHRVLSTQIEGYLDSFDGPPQNTTDEDYCIGYAKGIMDIDAAEAVKKVKEVAI